MSYRLIYQSSELIGMFSTSTLLSEEISDRYDLIMEADMDDDPLSMK